MPRLEDRTVADQIYEFLAPEQPDYCRQANLAILAHGLQVTGPVVHQGQVVSARAEGEEHAVHFDAEPALKAFGDVTNVNSGGAVEFDPRLIPADEHVAEYLKLPVAKNTPLPLPPAALLPPPPAPAVPPVLEVAPPEIEPVQPDPPAEHDEAPVSQGDTEQTPSA